MLFFIKVYIYFLLAKPDVTALHYMIVLVLEYNIMQGASRDIITKADKNK